MTGKEKRSVLLLGAGAVYDWEDAPTTSDLTKLILKSGFYCSDNETLITEFIFQTLLKSGYEEDGINFETIINVIEELIVFYSSFDKDKKTPSLLKAFFHCCSEEILFNFSVKNGTAIHGFKLEIPKGKEYSYQHRGALNNETPAQYFFQLLLAELLTDINAQINKYASHRNHEYSKVLTKENESIISLTSSWIKKLEAHSILRMYTLNYDRNFKVVALNNGINEVFEGFECGESAKIGTQIEANIPRILNDFESHCHYNLHGCAFWRIEPRDANKLFNAEIFLQANAQLQVNLSEQPYIQVEKGKSVLITNIITGYQKVQKGFISPFKQMQSAFEIDCVRANNLFIIGYSFGDEHINMSIKTALKHNTNIKIHIVDPSYDERGKKKGYEVLKQKFINVFTTYLNDWKTNKLSDTCSEYFNGKVTVHTIGMKEFLEKQNSF